MAHQEGLATIDDFADFKEDQLTYVFKNMRIAIPGVPAVLDAHQGNIVTPTVLAPIPPPFLISVRCALCLKVASIAYHYYISIGREPTSSNMNYSQVLHSFYVEWKALGKLTGEDKKPDDLMASKSMFPDALHAFCKEAVGVPSTLLVDDLLGEQTSRQEVKHFCHQVGTSLQILEEATQWANRTELYIQILKEAIQKDLREQNCPMVLWDYCAKRRAQIHNVTPCDLFQLNGNTPTMATFGIQGDISNTNQFWWYDWCYFQQEGKALFPQQKILPTTW